MSGPGLRPRRPRVLANRRSSHGACATRRAQLNEYSARVREGDMRKRRGLAAAACRGRERAPSGGGGGRQRLRGFERAAVVRAADFGLERMRVLLEEYEPRIYRRGAVLGAGAPARYVAAFNAQGAQERKLAQFGYAALQATSMLVRGDGDLADEEELEERGGGAGGAKRKGRGWREAQVPRVSLRHTALGRQCPSGRGSLNNDCCAFG
ncbi:Vacuolar protein sorting-associated protein 8 like protein, partial [Gryllus bimaculatus]